jgi:hypothetical protein
MLEASNQDTAVDLAEHVEHAMRADGLLPRWPRWQLEPTSRAATLRLDNGLAVRVVEDPFAPRVSITLEHHGSTHGMALDVALRFLPRYLPPLLEAAAEELRRIDMQTSVRIPADVRAGAGEKGAVAS